jgi:hypothetical protein
LSLSYSVLFIELKLITKYGEGTGEEYTEDSEESGYDIEGDYFLRAANGYPLTGDLYGDDDDDEDLDEDDDNGEYDMDSDEYEAMLGEEDSEDDEDFEGTDQFEATDEFEGSDEFEDTEYDSDGVPTLIPAVMERPKRQVKIVELKVPPHPPITREPAIMFNNLFLGW